MPASHSLCVGLAGKENSGRVLELNRLVIDPEHNGSNNASYLVGQSLKMLPQGTFVVSYADTAWGHVGYVYQATNFIYTGATKERKEIFVPGGKHSRHYDKHNIRYRKRSSKHRYVYLVGSKKDRREMRRQLRYKQENYPKGKSLRYDTENPQNEDRTY